MPEYTIGIKITAKSEDEAIRRVQQQIAGLGTAAKTAEGGFATLKAAAAGVMTTLAGFLGLWQVVNFFREGATAAMDEEVALKRVSSAAERFGQDGKKAADAAKELGDALRRVGFDDEEVIAGVATLMRYTDNYGDALKGVALAARIAQQDTIPFNTALDRVATLLSGSPRALNMVLTEFGIKATDAGDAFQKLGKIYTDESLKLDTEKTKWAAFVEQMKDIAKAIGGPVAGAILAVINIAKSALEIGSSVVATVWAEVRNVPANVADAMEGNWKATVDRQRETADTIRNIWEQLVRDVKDIWEPPSPTGLPQGPPKGKTPPPESPVDMAALNKAWTTQRSYGKNVVGLYTEQGLAADKLAAKMKQLAADETADAKARAEAEAWLTDFLIEDAALKAKLAQDNAAIKKAANQQAITDIATAAGYLYQAFPEFKAFAVAQATIDAIQASIAAGRATAGMGAWAAFAAQAAVWTKFMAAVMSMKEVEPSRGGGGHLAGGGASVSRSATGGGAGGGGTWQPTGTFYNPALGGGAPPVGGRQLSQVSNATNTNITVNTLTGSDATEVLRQFERKRLRPASKYKRSVINRGRTTIGKIGG